MIAFNGEKERERTGVLRTRAVRLGREEGTADFHRVPAGARTYRSHARALGHRCRHDAAEAGCNRRAHRQSGMADGLAERRSLLGASSTPAAVAGYPSITVPAGFARGLPVGLTFIGRAWSESRLIALAYAYEQSTKHRRAPTFPPTVPLS